ncbi:hypothetical protein HPB48_002143 [Haemaphysalis longicornis]|uniref:KIND domain-containing protein n=1 Tax=Haemaphysalis longicornis TaxID=44386 RepID=A0A9J6FGP4_HAELO|nr:hypothetical protein HPB48_002143 [Haemaphysalis longicornis]
MSIIRHTATGRLSSTLLEETVAASRECTYHLYPRWFISFIYCILQTLTSPTLQYAGWAMLLSFPVRLPCPQALLLLPSSSGGTGVGCIALSKETLWGGGGQPPVGTQLSAGMRSEHTARGSSACVAPLVCSLGLVLFHALEYGLGEDEEHVLSRPFEMLLDRMTSADPECCSDEDEEMSSDDDSGEEDCHDEGIEKDSGEDDPGGGDGGAGGKPPAHRAGLTLAKVLEMCASHLQNPAQADMHYKAVCRALVAEALELSTFLQKISSGTKAMLWMQVIRELRQGVKLKKVDVETHLHPVEYELTPYEMLLDDIRSQRYKLNKVMVNGDLPPRVKKDAHALILDFIRSRPPLFPVSRRQLKPAPRRETSVHDRLMADIRQPQVLRPVRRRSTSSSNSGQCQFFPQNLLPGLLVDRPVVRNSGSCRREVLRYSIEQRTCGLSLPCPCDGFFDSNEPSLLSL